jgi:hypothetical protein
MLCNMIRKRSDTETFDAFHEIVMKKIEMKCLFLCTPVGAIQYKFH